MLQSSNLHKFNIHLLCSYWLCVRLHLNTTLNGSVMMTVLCTFKYITLSCHNLLVCVQINAFPMTCFFIASHLHANRMKCFAHQYNLFYHRRSDCLSMKILLFLKRTKIHCGKKTSLWIYLRRSSTAVTVIIIITAICYLIAPPKNHPI